MSGKKIIKTREPGPEFQALASDWKPQVRRAWLVKPPPDSEGPPEPAASAMSGAPSDAGPAETAPAVLEVAPETVVARSALPAALAGVPLAARSESAAPRMGVTESAAPAKSGAPALAGGWTKVPNILLESLMRCDLGPRAIRVLLYLTRQTAGFHRDSVELSYMNIAAATNVGQAKLPAVLRELVARGFIERTSGNGKRNRFSVPAVSGTAALGVPAESVAPNSAGAVTPDSGGATSFRIGVATESENANNSALFRHETIRKESFS